MRVFLEGVGVVGPGLHGWLGTRAILAGLAEFQPAPVVVPPVALLPAAERRRTGVATRLALAAGLEALACAGREASDMATVFAASGSDGETNNEILCVLATPTREVSPTRFHNSVHNAPSGYWALATGARAPSSSLSAFDASFAAGLLDAAAQAVADARAVTLIAYDVPYPEPLHAARPIGTAFASAFVLTPQRGAAAIATLEIRRAHAGARATQCADADLENLRTGNPAARSLAVLSALARGGGEAVVEWLDGDCIAVAVDVP